MQLCDYSAAKLAQMLRKREIKATEIVESVFDRIEEREHCDFCRFQREKLI